jgi:hypothetical protein
LYHEFLSLKNYKDLRARFGVSTAVLVWIQLFWNPMLCRWKESNAFFIKGKADQKTKQKNLLPNLLAQMI